ncbi:hypothetical protein PHYPSEUDO_013052 [Phytophthora pseudosyringae]|uniref:Uncharacterized protein n=1 Tax=Phytophthora pseudosyringae TaxID=221518 RepID=A0A8T1V6F1_9STRA|nr:hypothetical protein PHYPSEUDO_013052 [Phytophthora pseudosyringae]
MDGAATDGHNEVVKWLSVKRAAVTTTAAMEGAAKNGHLGTVKLLQALGAQSNARAMDLAAAHGHVDVVVWHSENGCTVDAMDRAASNEHFDVVIFLRQSP